MARSPRSSRSSAARSSSTPCSATSDRSPAAPAPPQAEAPIRTGPEVLAEIGRAGVRRDRPRRLAGGRDARRAPRRDRRARDRTRARWWPYPSTEADVVAGHARRSGVREDRRGREAHRRSSSRATASRSPARSSTPRSPPTSSTRRARAMRFPSWRRTFSAAARRSSRTRPGTRASPSSSVRCWSGRSREHDALDLFRDVEMPLALVLAAMERRGVKVERAALEALAVEFRGALRASRGARSTSSPAASSTSARRSSSATSSSIA